MDEEVVVPFRSPRDRIEPVGRVRSTLVGSSLQALRRRGLEATYEAYLPAHCREPIFGCIAGTWLPIGLAIAHYEACDKLELTLNDRLEIGNEVAQQVQGSVLMTLARANPSASGSASLPAAAPGLTPWMALAQFQRLWDRLLDGGAIGVTKVGPKEARVETLGLPLARIPYFRTAFRGFVTASCDLFAKRIYTYEVARLCTDRTLGFRVAWA